MNKPLGRIPKYLRWTKDYVSLIPLWLTQSRMISHIVCKERKKKQKECFLRVRAMVQYGFSNQCATLQWNLLLLGNLYVDKLCGQSKGKKCFSYKQLAHFLFRCRKKRKKKINEESLETCTMENILKCVSWARALVYSFWFNKFIARVGIVSAKYSCARSAECRRKKIPIWDIVASSHTYIISRSFSLATFSVVAIAAIARCETWWNFFFREKYDLFLTLHVRSTVAAALKGY